MKGLKRTGKEEKKDYNSTIVLFTIALGTSIDAFAVGISFALLDVKIWESGILIGAVTFLASMTAIRIGKSAGERLGNKVEIIGGLILIAIGLKIFLEHILASLISLMFKIELCLSERNHMSHSFVKNSHFCKTDIS